MKEIWKPVKGYEERFPNAIGIKYSNRTIGELFGVREQTIWKIDRGIAWRKV